MRYEYKFECKDYDKATIECDGKTSSHKAFNLLEYWCKERTNYLKKLVKSYIDLVRDTESW